MAHQLQGRPLSQAAHRIIRRGLTVSTVSKRQLRPVERGQLRSVSADRALVFSIRPGASQRAALAALTELYRVIQAGRSPINGPDHVDLEVWHRRRWQSFGAIAALSPRTIKLHGTTFASRKVEVQRRFWRVEKFRRLHPALFGI